MKLIIFACGLSLVACLSIQHHDHFDEWHAWKLTHKRTYSNAYEENVRFTIWEENLRKINEHNHVNKKFVLKMNHFGDMTNTEFRAFMNGFRWTANRTGSAFLPPMHVNIPDSIDWRFEGYVTPVKDQKRCGSCWAFSTTGSLEGQQFKKTGILVSLSEQQLVDCSGSYGNKGCNGGLMDDAFRYIQGNSGIDLESSYPYTAEDGTCKFDPSYVAATVTGFTDVAFADENALKQAVATVGPISVGIDASHSSFQFYSSGIYDEQACSSKRLDHGVLVVGYGSEMGTDYWIVKNSWGTGWGDEGYIKMKRNANNQCGIASAASYPLV